MPEQWLAIAGYEGIYEVSTLGRVRSLDRVNSRGYRLKGRVLSLTKWNRHGHLRALLCFPGSQVSHSVHSLVLEAFVGPRPTGMHACHANDIPSDNRVENLRWDTPRANRLDSVRNGTNPNANKTECPKGHPYSAANTYRHPSGSRICRECTRANKRVRTEQPRMKVTKIDSQTVKTYDLIIEDGEVRKQSYTSRSFRVDRITVEKSDGNVRRVQLHGPVLKKDGTDSVNRATEKLYGRRDWPSWLDSIVGGLA